MGNLTVKHYLGIYTTRKEMQEKGITNPSVEIKRFTSEFVGKLMTYSPDEEIVLKEDSFFDSKGDLIMTIPSQKHGMVG